MLKIMPRYFFSILFFLSCSVSLVGMFPAMEEKKKEPDSSTTREEIREREAESDDSSASVQRGNEGDISKIAEKKSADLSVIQNDHKENILQGALATANVTRIMENISGQSGAVNHFGKEEPIFSEQTLDRNPNLAQVTGGPGAKALLGAVHEKEYSSSSSLTNHNITLPQNQSTTLVDEKFYLPSTLDDVGEAKTNEMELAQSKAKELRESNPALARRYEAVVTKYQEAAALFEQTMAMEGQGKIGQRNLSKNVANVMLLSAEAQFKAIKLREQGKDQLAESCDAVVEKFEAATKEFMQAFQASDQGKKNQLLGLSDGAKSTNEAALSTFLSAQAQFQAIKLREGGKNQVAERYEAIAAKDEEIKRLSSQALQMKGQREKSLLKHKANSMRLSAKVQSKAMELRERGDDQLAADYEAVAAKFEVAIALSSQSLQMELTPKEKDRLVNKRNLLTHAATATAVSAKAQLSAIRYREMGSNEFAAKYETITAKADEGLALFRQSLQMEAQGKELPAVALGYAAIATERNARLQFGATELREEGNDMLAAQCEEIAVEFVTAASGFMQAFQREMEVPLGLKNLLLFKKMEGESLFKTAFSIFKNAEARFSAIN